MYGLYYYHIYYYLYYLQNNLQLIVFNWLSVIKKNNKLIKTVRAERQMHFEIEAYDIFKCRTICYARNQIDKVDISHESWLNHLYTFDQVNTNII